MHRFIKAVGSGAKRARDLTRDEAREAMGLIAAGQAEPVQIGAFLLALRMKGEAGDELAGFVDALQPYLIGASTAPAGTLDVDCHGDGHAGRPTLLPAAACAAAALGVPVLLRADLDNPMAKHGLAAAWRSLAGDGVWDATRAASELESKRIALLDLRASCPPLHRLVALRPLFGVRTAAQTLMKLIDPMRASKHLVGVFHAPYLPSTARALALLGADGLCVQALGGLPEAQPGKQLRVASPQNPEPSLIDLRPLGAAEPVVSDEEEAGPDASELAVRDNRAALDAQEPAVSRAVAAAALLIHAARNTPILEAAEAARRAFTDGTARKIATT
jgi:anthranilate phosphoribosyltransferase